MPTAHPLCTRDDGPASLATWRLAFVLIMLTSGYLSIAVSQIALGVSLALTLLAWGLCRHRPAVTGLEKTTALLTGWALLMIPLSTDVAQSFRYSKRFYLFTAIWVVASAATTERRRMLMAWFMFGGALIISLVGVIRALERTGGLFDFRMHEISNPMTSGAMLMMIVLVAAGFLMAGGLDRRTKIIIAAVILPVVLAFAMTMTRSAFLGFFAGLGMMVLLVRPRLFGVGCVAGLLAVVVLLTMGERFLSERMWGRIDPQYILAGENTTSRLNMWHGGWQMIKARPLTGVGDRGLEEVSKEYYTSRDSLYFGHMHNNFVHLAVIWGVPGLVFGTLWLLAPAWLLVRRWRRLTRGPDAARAPPVLKGWVLGVLGAWQGFFIAGFTEWYVGDAETMLIYLALLGMALGPRLSEPDIIAEA